MCILWTHANMVQKQWRLDLFDNMHFSEFRRTRYSLTLRNNLCVRERAFENTEEGVFCLDGNWLLLWRQRAVCVCGGDSMRETGGCCWGQEGSCVWSISLRLAFVLLWVLEACLLWSLSLSALRSISLSYFPAFSSFWKSVSQLKSNLH